jgi:signal transduction histidine kinase
MKPDAEEFLALLAHELRTPISAIIGYQDLASEGILGDMDPRIAEAFVRIRSSADQLLTLVASLGEAAVHDVANLHVDTEDTDLHELLAVTFEGIMPEAVARGTTLTLDDTVAGSSFATDPERVQRALLLTLHGAIKASAGAELRFAATSDLNTFQGVLTGLTTSLADSDVNAGVLSAGSALTLRLAMAAQAIRPLGGAIAITPAPNGSVLTMTVPRTPPAGPHPD